MKIYLDTSVISHLFQTDVPERMKASLQLWEFFKVGKFQACLSRITLDELEKCYEPKRTKMYEFLSEIEYKEIPVTEQALVLAQKIVDLGILTKKSIDDCRHIALAILGNCDCIASWNFKHLVNVKTIRGVRGITNIEGYKGIEIVSPSSLIEMEV